MTAPFACDNHRANSESGTTDVDEDATLYSPPLQNRDRNGL